MSKNRDTARDIIKSALTFGINPSLEPMEKICELLGNPQNAFRCVQVAGTNGKSSTSRYVAALLRAHGYTTGLYTSPELVSITERVEINGNPVDDESFACAIIHVHTTALRAALELTEFELITAAALWLFAEHKVEYAVLEVGLGGRWDATTVVHPELVVLTGVDLDHTAILGNTIAEIAAEKAAIIKNKTTVVVAPTDCAALQVFSERAEKENARIVAVPAATVQESNSYQAQNKLTALIAGRELLGAHNIDEGKAREALENTIIPGRLEEVHNDPLVIIDAAHNPASARMLSNHLQLPHAVLLLAILADKDAKGIIEALAPCFEEIVVTQTKSPRAIPVGELAALVNEVTGQNPQAFEDPQSALETVLTYGRPMVATGSITLAGEVKCIFESKF